MLDNGLKWFVDDWFASLDNIELRGGRRKEYILYPFCQNIDLFLVVPRYFGHDCLKIEKQKCP